MTDAPAPVWCTLEQPDGPAVTSGEAALRAVVSNVLDRPFTCRRITIDLPVGPDGGALTDSPHRIRVVALDEGWTIEPGQRPGSLTAVPSSSPVTLAPGESIGIVLAGIATNEVAGAAEVVTTVVGGVDGETVEHSRTHEVGKIKPEVRIDHFAANPQSVEYKGKIQLSWEGAATAPSFYLQVGQKVPFELTERNGLKNNNGSYTFPLNQELTTNTPIRLRAVKGEAENGAITLVTVNKGDVTAGDLTVNGVATLLRGPSTLTLDKKVWSSKEVPTDGMIAAAARTGDANKNAVLQISVLRKGKLRDDTELHRMTATSTHVDRTENVLVPVPKGTAVRITKVKEPDSSVFTATWFPIGSGDFEVNT
ncbi:hypothetical protein SAMN04487905_12210 [Actinopolyspora xinjiangensis]|uniref:Uncharacterized protein n=1 Tax=Actinopolyspora xinjiangensis TaxID=405564 RepID=A0A1H0X1P8_9ACTN|nr:hypothetical protein [Actinopolyspora xinjiangensis]SDP96871.1 hypothetical protein SAMN04487905_12210 [Actinopolyspora xinjiangensis]